MEKYRDISIRVTVKKAGLDNVTMTEGELALAHFLVSFSPTMTEEAMR